MSDAFKTALIRGAISAFVIAGASFFGVLSSDQLLGQHIGSAQIEGAGIASGVVFFTQLALRAGIEGTIDSRAASQTAPKA